MKGYTMTTNIYILKLKGGRYYVGKSKDPMKRYQEHMNGSGSAWTRKHKPIGLEKIIPNQTDFDEDKWVKVYMNKHGIEKVRGGAYVLEELPEFQEEALKSELWGSTNKCTTCGREGHWAKDCYAKTDKTGAKIIYEQIPKATQKQNPKQNSKKNNNCCYRCGRSGHYAPDCYAQRDKNGYDLDSDEYDDLDSDQDLDEYDELD